MYGLIGCVLYRDLLVNLGGEAIRQVQIRPDGM